MCDNHPKKPAADNVVGWILSLTYISAVILLVVEFNLIYWSLVYIGLAGGLVVILAVLWVAVAVIEFLVDKEDELG